MLLDKDTKLNRLDRPGHPDGMTVPEGYFEDFNKRMAAMLPPNDLERQADAGTEPAERTVWERLRPFVYMAAMFAGVWCMMKMFTMMRGADPAASAPAVYADAQIATTASISYDDFSDYVMTGYSETDLLDDLYSSGFEPTSFQL